MIFFGSGSSTIKSGKINNVICPNCNNQTSMNYAIFGKYAHLYWCPVFPTGKENILECNSCSKTYKLNQLPQSIHSKFDFEKQGSRYPVWYFSGLAIIALIVVAIGYNAGRIEKRSAEYMQAPMAGDVYHINLEESTYYSSARVDKVKGDSIFITYNDFEISSRTGINDIDLNKNYTDQTDAFQKQELVTLFEDGVIFKVDR